MIDYIVNEQRTIIWVDGISFHVWRIFEGSYWLSQDEITNVIGETAYSFQLFLDGENFERLAPQYRFDAELRRIAGLQGDHGIVRCVSLFAAIYYWSEKAATGNDKAFRLVRACIADAIEWRTDWQLDSRQAHV